MKVLKLSIIATIGLSLMVLMQLILSKTAMAFTKCIVNGTEVSCATMDPNMIFQVHVGASLYEMNPFIALSIMMLWVILIIFWILMLVHAIVNPIPYKVLWVILIIFTGILGALIYYFAIKLGFDQQNLQNIQNLQKQGVGLNSTAPSTISTQGIQQQPNKTKTPQKNKTKRKKKK
jgi:hypothetical protein